MGVQKHIYLVAGIGQEVKMKHPKREGLISGVVQDVTCRLKDNEYTYHVLTRTREGKPFNLLAQKKNIVEVEGKVIITREKPQKNEP